MNTCLPLRSVPGFEARLEEVWWGAKGRGRGYARRRDALAMGLGLCGLRSAEILDLRRDDVDFMEYRVRVRSAKGGVPRVIVVGQSWGEGLRETWRRWPSNGTAAAERLAFYTWLRRGCERLAYRQLLRRCYDWTRAFFGQRYSLHSLRHTAAVRMYQATHDVLEVQRYLGHQSLQWTSTYLQSIRVVCTDGMPGFASGSGARAGLRLFDPEGLSCGREQRPGVPEHSCVEHAERHPDTYYGWHVTCSVCLRVLSHGPRRGTSS